jgi:hypothetical protein
MKVYLRAHHICVFLLSNPSYRHKCSQIRNGIHVERPEFSLKDTLKEHLSGICFFTYSLHFLRVIYHRNKTLEFKITIWLEPLGRRRIMSCCRRAPSLNKDRDLNRKHNKALLYPCIVDRVGQKREMQFDATRHKRTETSVCASLIFIYSEMRSRSKDINSLAIVA